MIGSGSSRRYNLSREATVCTSSEAGMSCCDPTVNKGLIHSSIHYYITILSICW